MNFSSEQIFCACSMVLSLCVRRPACLCMCLYGFECLIGFMMHRWAKWCHLHDWRPSALGLDPVSSHSPSAPLILSKSHYNPTNPTASHYDSLLSGSPTRHIRIWNWAGGSPITISEKADSPLSVCLSLITIGKRIRSWATGAEGYGLGEVGGNSVTCKRLLLLALEGLFLLLSSIMCYHGKKKTNQQNSQTEKNDWFVSMKWDLTQLSLVDREGKMKDELMVSYTTAGGVWCVNTPSVWGFLLPRDG